MTSPLRASCVDVCGYAQGHAYGILQMKTVTDGSETFNFVQCRNPWGQGEWKGDWADNDVMWDDYPAVRAQLNPVRAACVVVVVVVYRGAL